MTVPGARRQDTALAYSGGTLDRASNQRTDPAFLDATLAAAGARVIPLWQLIELAAARGRLGRPDSIGHYLLHSWLAENR